MRRVLALLFVLAATLPSAESAATETCGDLIDDDDNDLVDEGCNPAGLLRVCESTLSCGRTGAVAPKTGQLVYQEPADLDIRTPFGPSLSLARVYQSRTADGSGYRGSLGTSPGHRPSAKQAPAHAQKLEMSFSVRATGRCPGRASPSHDRGRREAERPAGRGE